MTGARPAPSLRSRRGAHRREGGSYQVPARLTGGTTAASAPSCGRRCPPSLLAVTVPTWSGMFSGDEPTAEAIRRAYEHGGEFAAAVEFKRHFPLISDNAKARECVRIIAGWQPIREASNGAGTAAGQGGP